MLKKTIFFSLLLSLVLIGSSLVASNVYGQTSIIDPNASGTESPNPYEKGDYTLNDIMAVAIGVSRWILGVVGSLSLIMFIYGGFVFLISAGSSDKIGQAKKIIVAAVVGLLIVFASYLIIKFVLQSLGLNWNGKVEQMKPTAQIILSLK